MIKKKVRMGQYLVLECHVAGETYVEVLEPTKPHVHAVTRRIDGLEWGDTTTRRLPEPMHSSMAAGPERIKAVREWIEYCAEVAEEIAQLALYDIGDSFDKAAKTSINAQGK